MTRDESSHLPSNGSSFQPLPPSEYEWSPPLSDAYFYHTIDLPNIGLQRGHWDLRGSETSYLGGLDVHGETVFDCGVASGFMAFEMERRGANVIGLDLDNATSSDMGLIPYYNYARNGYTWDQAIAYRHESQRKLRNSFLIARRAVNSNVKLLVGNLMYSPITETADCALFGMILLHLRDPIAALYNVASRVRKTIIVSEPMEIDNLSMDDTPNMLWRPSADGYQNAGTWWYMSPSLLKRALEVVGFHHFSVSSYSVKQDTTGTMVPVFTLVATRKYLL